MPGRAATLLQRIVDKARRGNRGDPVGTVAFYGPDDQRASKVVVGISPDRVAGITDMRKWFSEQDVREDVQTLQEILAFMSEKQVKSVVVTDGIYGCPHEAGIDYPEGGDCAECAFWKDKERDVPLIG